MRGCFSELVLQARKVQHVNADTHIDISDLEQATTSDGRYYVKTDIPIDISDLEQVAMSDMLC